MANIDGLDIDGLSRIREDVDPALAEIISQLNGRISALETIIQNMLFKNVQIDSLNVVKQLNIYGGTNLIIIGTGAPSIVPDFIGQFFVNTTGGVTYQAKGIASTSDWKQTSN